MEIIRIPRKAPLYLLILLIALNVVFYVIDVPGNRKESASAVQKVYAQETENDIVQVRASAEPEVDESVPFTDEEIDLLAIITMAEAEGESELGKRLVIDTILNRIDSEVRYFPDTVYDVVYQKNAFEPVWNGRMDRCYVMDDIRQLVLEEIENRTNYDVVYFTAGKYNEYGTPLFKEGNHYFSGH